MKAQKTVYRQWVARGLTGKAPFLRHLAQIKEDLGYTLLDNCVCRDEQRLGKPWTLIFLSGCRKVFCGQPARG